MSHNIGSAISRLAANWGLRGGAQSTATAGASSDSSPARSAKQGPATGQPVATRPAIETPMPALLLRGRNCRDLTGSGQSKRLSAQAAMGQFQAHARHQSQGRVLRDLARSVCVSLGGRKMSDANVAWALREAATHQARMVGGAVFSDGRADAAAVTNFLTVLIDVKADKTTGRLSLEDVAGIHLAIVKEVKDPDLRKRCLNLLSDQGGWKQPGSSSPAKSRLTLEVEQYIRNSDQWPRTAMDRLDSVALMQGGTITREDQALALKTLSDHHANEVKFGGPDRAEKATEKTKTVLSVMLKALVPPGRPPDVTLASTRELDALVRELINDPQLASDCCAIIAKRASWAEPASAPLTDEASVSLKLLSHPEQQEAAPPSTAVTPRGTASDIASLPPPPPQEPDTLLPTAGRPLEMQEAPPPPEDPLDKFPDPPTEESALPPAPLPSQDGWQGPAWNSSPPNRRPEPK